MTILYTVISSLLALLLGAGAFTSARKARAAEKEKQKADRTVSDAMARMAEFARETAVARTDASKVEAEAQESKVKADAERMSMSLAKLNPEPIERQESEPYLAWRKRMAIGDSEDDQGLSSDAMKYIRQQIAQGKEAMKDDYGNKEEN